MSAAAQRCLPLADMPDEIVVQLPPRPRPRPVVERDAKPARPLPGQLLWVWPRWMWAPAEPPTPPTSSRRRPVSVHPGQRLTAEERAFRPEALRILAEHQRPKTRADCLPGGCNEQRPCPWASCRHHLALSVNAVGSLKQNFPGVEIEDMRETCALDVADRGEPLPARAVAELVNLRQTRVLQYVQAFQARMRGVLTT